MEASQEEQKGGIETVKPIVEKLPFTTYREYFDDSYKVGACLLRNVYNGCSTSLKGDYSTSLRVRRMASGS